MAPMIVPGVCRYTINGTYADLPVANVLDMHISGESLGTSREDAIADQGAIIISAWVDHVLGNIVDRYRALSCSWVDMDAADGSTGEITNGTGSDFPHFGGLTSQGQPGNVAWLVHKQLTAARGSRAGRMYLAGVSEAATDHDSPNVGLGTFVADINTGLAAFLSAINQESGVGTPSYDSELVVVHTHNSVPKPGKPVPEYVGRSHVDHLVCDVKLKTQRRRLG